VIRLEFGFLLLGTGLTIFLSVVTNALVPILTGQTVVQQVGPLTSVIGNAVIAYGIATRRILEVRQVMRMGTAYALLAFYLSLLYLGVWFPLRWVALRWLPGMEWLAHLTATAALVVSVAPAHGLMQRFANNLFINLPTTDVGRTADRVGELLQAIGDIRDLLANFCVAVGREVGTDQVRVLLREDGAFRESSPAASLRAPLTLDDDDPLVAAAAASRQPLVAEILHRYPVSPEVAQARGRMEQLGISAAVGVHAKNRFTALLLLGPRLSARVYGNAEQRALQVAADRLAAAIENLRLYTQLQDSKRYSEILVEQLVSGVVATDDRLRVTVFNSEAERLTGLNGDRAIGAPAESLPQPLAGHLRAALDHGQGVRDLELTLQREDEEAVPIQLGSAVLRGHDGRALGALVVFTDLRAVKKLESQVRRSAHLASLGTLSAGMAHEIRNPLQTVKTFCQLLPDRYTDADFRQRFATLVESEVARIDTIVNQLLQFGRPAKARLEPTSVHGVLNHSLELVEARMERRGVQLAKHLSAPRHVVMADANLLEQAIVNLLLNALDAMPQGGWLTVSTSLCPGPSNADRSNGARLTGGAAPVPAASPATGSHAPSEFIQIGIRDTGTGIPPDDLPHVFDPFFTTKPSGVGLGLPVAHGIVEEHMGIIEAESAVGAGTQFRLLLPLCERDVPSRSGPSAQG
jgi:signal transduction histidine kinase